MFFRIFLSFLLFCSFDIAFARPSSHRRGIAARSAVKEMVEGSRQWKRSPLELWGKVEDTNPILPRLDRLCQGVVTISEGKSFGSGFFITSEGHILTNAHVVGNSRYVDVSLSDGRQLRGEVLRLQKKRDVALVKVEGVQPEVLPIRRVRYGLGRDVYAIGTPLKKQLFGSVSRGVVSAYRTEGSLGMIQSDVRILPGNSGGPLLDEMGNVVGLAKKVLYHKESPTLSFFIPVEEALSELGLTLLPM